MILIKMASQVSSLLNSHVYLPVIPYLSAIPVFLSLVPTGY